MISNSAIFVPASVIPAEQIERYKVLSNTIGCSPLVSVGIAIKDIKTKDNEIIKVEQVSVAPILKNIDDFKKLVYIANIDLDRKVIDIAFPIELVQSISFSIYGTNFTYKRESQ